MDGTEPPQPPIQHKFYDLASSQNRGMPKGKNEPSLGDARSDRRSPAQMMRAMGFTQTKHMTPLQFLCAVFNNELEMIYRCEKRRKKTEEQGGIGLSYRLEAAKTAAKYLHMEMPKVTVEDEGGNYGTSLMKAAASGNERLRTRTMIIETVERISPDVPLPDASYPPMYQKDGQTVIDEQGNVEGEALNPEGDTNYDGN